MSERIKNSGASLDEFTRANSGASVTSPLLRQSTTNNLSTSQLNRSSMRSAAAKKDPYNLDFKELRSQYMEDSTIKMPFVKSSFVHYAKSPTAFTYQDREYKNTMITMELVQAPLNMTYTALKDPKIAKQQEKEHRLQELKQQAIEKKKQERAEKKAALKAEIEAERAEAKEEKRLAKEARLREKEEARQARAEEKQAAAEEKEARKQEREAKRQERLNKINAGDSDVTDEESEEEESEEESAAETTEEDETEEEDEEGTDEDDEEEEDEVSEIDDEALDEYLDDYDEESGGSGSGSAVSDSEYGSEENSGSYGSSGAYDSYGGDDDDREYTGDMFPGVKPVKYAPGRFELQGEHNPVLNTNDYVCISLWEIDPYKLRFSRIRDVIIQVPPITTDQRFYVSHSGKSIYWLGLKNKVKTLVEVHLKNLDHTFHELKGAEHVQNCKETSLVKNHFSFPYSVLKNEEVEKVALGKYTRMFDVYDLTEQKVVWTIPNCQSLFWRGVNAEDLDPIKFKPVDNKLKKNRGGDEGAEDSDAEESEVENTEFGYREEGEAAEGEDMPETFGICAIITTLEEVEVEDEKKDKDDEDEKDEKEVKEKKKQIMRIIRTHTPNFQGEITEENCRNEFKLEAKLPTTSSSKKDKKAEEKEPTDKAAPEMSENQKAALLSALPTMPNGQKFGMGLIDVDDAAHEHEGILTVSSFYQKQIAIVIVGSEGEQHKLILFNDEKREPISITQRSGATTLSFNENAHTRDDDMIFLITTEANGQCSAKPIQFEQVSKMPVITIKDAEKEKAKDCWIFEDEDDQVFILSLCKSSNDEYLNASSTSYMPDEDNEDKFLLKTIESKVVAQQIDISYPCVVSNIGQSRVVFQCLSNPDQIATFNLDDQKMDFLAFAQYQDIKSIGFVDKRSADEKKVVPFNEKAEKVAFLTRKQGICDSEECSKGDVLLNILVIDTYSKPMKFDLYTTKFEACMEEGICDDTIYSAFVMQMTSVRGLDVSFVCQYNDRVIFDCITSTRQLPIRFPLAQNEKEVKMLKKNDFEEHEMWEPMELSKFGKMVRQNMVMDKHGALYFMMQPTSGLTKVYRVDPLAEMGTDSFVKSVYQMRSNQVYFFLYSESENAFYTMDETKKIRVLQQDPETFVLSQSTTFELAKKDQSRIFYSDFDEYTISDQVLHWNDRMFFLLDSVSKDNLTWQSEEIMLENHIHVSGPVKAKNCGMIYTLQQFSLDMAGNDDDDNNDQKVEKQANPFSLKGLLGGHKDEDKNFKGYSIVMQPLGDLSFMDLLPQFRVNNNNFCSFIDETHVITKYAGRFLIFNQKCQFITQVQFEMEKEGFKAEQLKLICTSDSMKFFVFEGPQIKSKEEKEAKKQKKDDKKNKKMSVSPIGGQKNMLLGQVLAIKKEQEAEALKKKQQGKKASGGKKAPRFYVFKLEQSTNFFGKTSWKFIPYVNKLYPMIEQELKTRTVVTIDHKGVMNQCTIMGSRQVEDQRELDILVKVCESKKLDKKEPNKAEEAKKKSSVFGSIFSSAEEDSGYEERYLIKFDANSKIDKEMVLRDKIKSCEKAIALKTDNKDSLERLKKRRSEIERAWVFGNYLVAKSGSELKFIQRERSSFGSQATEAQSFQLTPGAEVWVDHVYSTGVEDLVQIFIMDDRQRRIYILTWNLQFNREHSIYQSTYGENVFPENLLLRGFGGQKRIDFNFFMDNGAIINLETNIPTQLFDMENEADTMPKGPLKNNVPGQKKISEDRSRYLDLTAPGRIHHFISLADLLYWERYQQYKDRHELARGKMTTWSPIARFPNGISVFHWLATNVKVLSAVRDAMNVAKGEQREDQRVDMLPLLFLHSNPKLNKPGARTTPLHIALDKQSPLSFEAMLELLVDQKKVSVTSQLLDRLEVIINLGSPAVNELFDQSFIITDQFDGPKAIEWDDDDEEKRIAISSAYLTEDLLQILVDPKADAENNANEEGGNQFLGDGPEDFGSQSFVDTFGKTDDDKDLDAPEKYSLQVENLAIQSVDESNLKQVEARVLDFSWVFTGDNAAKFLQILSKTDNDEIFATSQVRVFIDFMWDGYFNAILRSLFLPYCCFTLTFLLYALVFSQEPSNNLSLMYFGKIACIVYWGKMFVTFTILEIIQSRRVGLSYLTDFWNLVDLSALLISAFYMVGSISGYLHQENQQIVASVAALLLWIKMFYWMRLFRAFAAFIRMITEILKDIQVFMVMLLLCLGAFTSVIMILQINRSGSDEEVAPIYDAYIGFPFFDAFIHAYLTGLGDFNKDNYSERDAVITWVMFLIATVLVQLVFMNLLIAIMGESFSKIMAMMEQSTQKELCSMMEDHIWLQRIDELFATSRYILWLTPQTDKNSGTAVERQIAQLKDYVEDRADQSDQKILREIQVLSEEINAGVRAQFDQYKEEQRQAEEDE